MAIRKSAAAAAEAPAEAQSPVGREIKRPIIPGRAVAYNRAGKPIQRAGAETGVDDFHIPEDLLHKYAAEGWSLEWKRESVTGETDPFYMSKLNQVGWEPVMYESYPGRFAPEYDDKGQATKGPVRRKGLMLMERDLKLTREAMMDEKRRADERVGNSVRQYSRVDTRGTSTAEFDDTAARASYIRQTKEVVSDPAEPTPRYRQQVD